MYYRLSMLKLDIPPLRERPDDLALLADRFLQMLNERSFTSPKTMSEDFLRGLRTYSWPGNIRQLQNSIARAFFTSASPVLTAEDLAQALDRSEDTEPQPAATGESGGGAIMAALTIRRRQSASASAGQPCTAGSNNSASTQNPSKNGRPFNKSRRRQHCILHAVSCFSHN